MSAAVSCSPGLKTISPVPVGGRGVGVSLEKMGALFCGSVVATDVVRGVVERAGVDERTGVEEAAGRVGVGVGASFESPPQAMSNAGIATAEIRAAVTRERRRCF
jgi:hypothetical protein